MNIKELKQRLDELDRQAERAWTEYQSYEVSQEYLAVKEKTDALQRAWHEVYRQAEALRFLLSLETKKAEKTKKQEQGKSDTNEQQPAAATVG